MIKRVELVLIGMLLIMIGSVWTANADKRILFVDSNAQGNALSDSVTQGIMAILEGKNIALKIHQMNTETNNPEIYKKNAALLAKSVIADFKPNVVIASGDNASKYLIVPYFKGSDMPFVFCGLKFSADAYGFPFSNVTGIEDILPIQKLIYALRNFCHMETIGYLATDARIQHKYGQFMQSNIREDFIAHYVDNLEDWKEWFIRFQTLVDILIIGDYSGIKDWNNAEVERFTLERTKIPTGCMFDWLTPYAFLGATRDFHKEGAYAASVALKILNGTSVSSLSIVKETETLITINKKIGDHLGLKIPNSFLKVAQNVIQ